MLLQTHLIIQSFLSKKRWLITILFISFLANRNTLVGQIYQGYEKSNYSGIIGTDFQPASVVDNRTKFDLLVGGFGTSIENNIIQLDVANIGNLQHSNITSYLRGVENFNITNEGFINVQTQMNVLSMMYSPARVFGIGLNIKARNIARIDGFSTESVEYLFDRLNEISGPGFYPDNSFHYNSASFLEAGLTLGAGFGNKVHAFRVGVTGNYLVGMDFLDLDVRKLDLRVTSMEEIESVLDISYARSETFGESPIIERLGGLNASQHTGFGLNLGLVYEFRPRFKNHFYGPIGKPKLRDDLNKYHIRVGLSVKDLGWIDYQTSGQSTIFQDSVVISPSSLTLDDPSDFEMVLDTINQTGFSPNFIYNLPTHINAYVDLRITQEIYLNLAYRSRLDITNTSQPQLIGEPQITITPRIESKVVEIGFPIRIIGSRSFIFGSYFRFGPFLIGSGTVGSLLVRKRAYNLNAYAALRIPLNRKKP